MQKPIPFNIWLEDIRDEIEIITQILSEKMSDNPVELYQQLVKAEVWNARISSLLAEANSFLDRAESTALKEVTGTGTDLDRRVNMRARVANERRVRDILLGLGESIRNRTILGMSLRRQNAGERTL